MRSVMNHNFSQVPSPQIQRSVFDRSHGHKTTIDAGYLYPIFVDEILPGDTLRMDATFFGRFATLIFPIMDNVFLETFFFYVPARLLWEHWEQFNGSQANPTDTTDYLIPCLDNDGDPMQFASGDIQDYMGLPIGVDFKSTERINALPFRAYNLIWNEWFRDQNQQNSLDVPLDDGPDQYGIYAVRRRGKRHDYFTSALPWPQKGDAVTLPLGTLAPVIGDGQAMGLIDGTSVGQMVENTQGGVNLLSLSTTMGHAVGDAGADYSAHADKFVGLSQDKTKSHVFADLSSATAATVNQLRQAFQFQKVLERDARGGTRYTEFLRAHFGVTSPDFRLQRPEYLGGSSQRISVSQVAQTSNSQPSDPTVTPQGNLSAFGTVGTHARFNKSFVEHGYVIGLVNIRADITYQQGINRMWSRSTRFDFYLPALAHLGEQAILNKELFYPNGGNTGGADVDEAFGYQERWAEMRYKPSMVTGKFRSQALGTLDSWHLALDFDDFPVLGTSWIPDDPPIARVIAVDSEPHMILDMYFSMKHARPLPVYSVPGQIDRF